jgi:long-chain acyl-CoA synthetase
LARLSFAQPKREDARKAAQIGPFDAPEETPLPAAASGLPADALTFPRLLLHHARVRGGRTAMREKDLGIWQSWTWAQSAQEVRRLACGLAALGFRRGMNLAVIGDNRPRLYWAFAAAQSLGGVPVPLYQDAIAE